LYKNYYNITSLLLTLKGPKGPTLGHFPSQGAAALPLNPPLPRPPSWIWGREDRERVRDGKGKGGKGKGRGGKGGREGKGEGGKGEGKVNPPPPSKNSGHGLGF